jgi:hypothetical protein
MSKYLGEKRVDIKKSPYANYTRADWALEFIAAYGQIDGAHHKQWVLDQVARILNGTPVILTLASWADGKQEYRSNLGKPSPEYLAWAKERLGKIDEDGEPEYRYDEGIAP